MDFKRYQEIINGFAGRRVAVLGDLMVDSYLWGRATRISPESPVMVVEVDRESSVPGGAANVVNNLIALGASVEVCGVIGSDDGGRELVDGLKERGAGVAGIITDSSRPTTRKTRIFAHNQQLIRFDREQTCSLSADVASELIARMRRVLDSCDALVISDYNKGVLSSDVEHAAVSLARDRGILLTANPKPANARSLRGAHVVQLNQVEAESLSELPSKDGPERESAGAGLAHEIGVENLIVTGGARGLTVWTSKGEIHHIPPHPVEVYDVAGAGDTVISTLTLAILAGGQIQEAADIANHAAACVVRKLGVATVSRQEILADWEETRT